MQLLRIRENSVDMLHIWDNLVELLHIAYMGYNL